EPAECVSDGLDEVRLEFFTSRFAREVWQEIDATLQRGEVVDRVMIGDRLHERVDPLEFARLFDLAPSAANFATCLYQVKEAYRKRSLFEGAERVLAFGSDPDRSSEDLANMLYEAQKRADEAGSSLEAVELGRILPGVLRGLEERFENPSAGCVPTGIPA